jgi:hypothetical protein
VPLTGTTALCNWPDHPHIGRVHLEVPRNTDCPSKLAPDGTARSAHNRHPPTRSRSAHRSRWHDRSPAEPFPVLFVPFDIRPEHPLAPTETACSSNSQEETTATPARPALRLVPASAIPGSGSSRSCPALTHIAQRHQPNACLSWVSRSGQGQGRAEIDFGSTTSLSAMPLSCHKPRNVGQVFAPNRETRKRCGEIRLKQVCGRC